jgi:hypothetical protein
MPTDQKAGGSNPSGRTSKKPVFSKNTGFSVFLRSFPRFVSAHITPQAGEISGYFYHYYQFLAAVRMPLTVFTAWIWVSLVTWA